MQNITSLRQQETAMLPRRVLVMGKSIRINSRCRIVMKNFDSVPQLQRFSYVHHCTARSRHGSHSRQRRHSLLQRQLAALCCNAGRPVMASVDWSSSFKTRVTPEPLVWTVVGGSDRAVNRIESFSFLPNRPSLARISAIYAKLN